ncbi:unnamed protein product, partial [Prorocentrum cordatum]
PLAAAAAGGAELASSRASASTARPGAAPAPPTVLEVSSRRSPVFRRLQRLLQRKGRTEARRFLAEGDAFLQMRPRTVFVRRSRWEGSSGAQLRALWARVCGGAEVVRGGPRRGPRRAAVRVGQRGARRLRPGGRGARARRALGRALRRRVEPGAASR